jgi:hypothetical protein
MSSAIFPFCGLVILPLYSLITFNPQKNPSLVDATPIWWIIRSAFGLFSKIEKNDPDFCPGRNPE